MAEFTVKPKNMKLTIDEELRLARELSEIESDIRNIGNSLSFRIASGFNLRVRLINASNKASAHRSNMSSMGHSLQSVSNAYERAENTILGNINVGNAKAQSSGVAEESADKGWLEENWEWLKEFAGAVGPVGGAVAVIGDLCMTDWAEAASDFWDTAWDFGDAVKMCKENTDIKWWKALTGLVPDEFLTSISKSNLSWTQRAAHGWDKGIKGTLREFKNLPGGIKQVGGIILSLVGNGVSNYKEWQTGAISTGRAWAETITETAVDWGKDLLIAAGVTAAFAAAGFAAPVLAVGAATVAVSVAADWVCEKITGKGVTELVSDAILDTAEAVGDAVKTGATKIKEGASVVWSGLKQGLSWLTGSDGQPKFA